MSNAENGNIAVAPEFVNSAVQTMVTTPLPGAAESAFLASLPWYGGKPRIALSSVQIESKLFETPLGEGFLGQHIGLGLPVVVRVMRPAIRAELNDLERFIAETRRLGQVRHPNLTGLIDVGEHQGFLFAVFEYICGVPLIERIRQKPLTEAKALGLLIPIADSLCELWRRGFVHRAVSPFIIHLQNCGSPKLDLGTLRRNHTDPRILAMLAPTTTPYWSPEELRGQPVDPSSDMWSFGATLFHAVTGRTPFEAKSENGMKAAILSGDLLDPRDASPEIRPAFRELLLKLLAPKPEDRFIAMEDFYSALRVVAAQISGTPVPQPAIMMTELEAPLLPPAPRPIDIGQIVGNCRLDKKVGTGAFGVVYRARHRVLDIDVAVKILPVEAAQRDPSFVDLFLREARTAARLRHPNVISIYEAGVQDGQHYLIMEFAAGGTVAERLFVHGGKLPVPDAARIILQAARGLAAAERLNIVHRDIKPDNLMFGSDGEIKIADLGLAKRRLPTEGKGDPQASLLADQLSMRDRSGMLAGTPAYIAPEMAVEPEKVDTRADLYSLGVTFYQLLTGKLPFEGPNVLGLIMKHVLEEAPPIEELDPALPRELCEIVARLLKKKPADRLQSAQELVKALEAFEVQALK